MPLSFVVVINSKVSGHNRSWAHKDAALMIHDPHQLGSDDVTNLLFLRTENVALTGKGQTK